MSRQLEITIEEAVCKWAEKNGWLAAKLQWLNETGWPDRTFMKDGIVAWIEFKKPGGRLSKKQKYWIEVMQRMGLNVVVCDNELEATSYLYNLELEARDD